MSKKTTNDVIETVDTSTETSEPIATVDNEVKAYLVKKEDGYHIEDLDGNLGEVCKFSKDGTRIMFTPNASNRKETMVKVAEPFFAENPDGKIALTYKATRTLDGVSRSTKLPNEKLIAYLPEVEQEEYKAIIARAIQARDAEREASKKPMSEADKAKARVNKIIAQLKDMGVPQERIDAILAEAKSNVENKEVENND